MNNYTKAEDLVFRLRKRAEIRRQIKDRKSVQEGKPDRLADLLEEAATELEKLQEERKFIDPACLERGCICYEETN